MTLLSTMTHRGYTGSVEVSKEDNCLCGKVLFIRALLTYEGQTLNELREDFKGVVDEYLADCKANSWMPEKPFKGSFNVRVSPAVHRGLAIAAAKRGESLNKYVAEVLAASI